LAITVKCTGCGKTLKVKDELAGKRGKCPGCGTIIQIPKAPAAPPASPSTEQEQGATGGDANVDDLLASFGIQRAVSAGASSGMHGDIRAYYEAAFERARRATGDRVLDDVRVAPGEDPYVAGHTALLAHGAEIHRMATAKARLETLAEYGISEEDLNQILKAKQEG